MFKELSELIPEGGMVRMVITKKNNTETKEELLSVALVPDFGKTDVSATPKPLIPLCVTRPASEIDEKLLEDILSFTPAATELYSTVDAAVTSAQARKAEMKQRGKKGVKKVTEVQDTKNKLKERKKGEENADDISSMVTIPSTDSNFTSALNRASFASLNKAARSNEISKSNRSKVANEISKFSDKTAKEVLTEVLTEMFKTTTNGTAKGFGKELEKISGKSLADLGLAPKQASLV